MPLTLPASFFVASLGLILLGCAAEVPPPNPIAGEPDQLNGSGNASKGTSGTAAKSGKADGQGPQGAGEGANTGPNWKNLKDIPMAGPLLEVAVTTTETCCGDSKVLHEGSPARFYLAIDDGKNGENGFLLWLGEKDRVVLSRQTGPGVYNEEIYRSKKPALRELGTVTLSCPAELLGANPMYIWAGNRVSGESVKPVNSSVAGVSLPPGRDGGEIPSFRLVPTAGSSAP